MNEYPKFLENHSTDTFSFENRSAHLNERKAYFHEQYPLLMHQHDFHEVNIIVKGNGRHYIKNKNYPAKVGDVFFIPPFIRHGYWTDKPDEMQIFHLLIEKSLLTNYQMEINRFPGFHILFEIEPHIRQNTDDANISINIGKTRFNSFIQKMKELIETEKQHFDGADILFNLKAVCLLCELSSLVDMEHVVHVENNNSEEILNIIQSTEYINANYSEKLTLESLTKIACMSVSTYCKYFKKIMGESPMEYLKKIRIKHAAEKLSNSSNSISTIAMDCGFFDSSHFIKYFKEYTGKTPVEYRNDIARNSPITQTPIKRDTKYSTH